MTHSAPPRRVLAVSGADRVGFLQDLVTNDVRGLERGPVYAALLSPQGKYLADFILVADGDAILIDVAEPLAEGLARRLAMYRLRRKVEVAPTELRVETGAGDVPEGGFADPRDPGLGWRRIGSAEGPGPSDAVRVEFVVPEAGIELIPEESYVLEMGFERLNGVDFRKGCYVGQEIVARMKHKTELRKGLARVVLNGPAATGAPVESGGKAAGTLGTISGDRALATLRFDRVGETMTAGTADLRLDFRG